MIVNDSFGIWSHFIVKLLMWVKQTDVKFSLYKLPSDHMVPE